MADGILNQTQSGFSRMLITSFILHLAFLGLGLFVRMEPKRIFSQPIYTMVEVVEEKRPTPEVIKPSPPEPKKEEKAIKKIKPPKEKISPDNAIARMERKIKEDELVLSRIKGMEKRLEKKDSVREDLDKIREDLSAESKKEGVEIEEKKPQKPRMEEPIKARSNAAGLKSAEYSDIIRSMIRSAWIYPGEVKKDLQVIVLLRILGSGQLKDVRVEKRSGSVFFDESALRAVKKASPFPPLPEEIQGEFELGARFSLEGVTSLE